MRYKSSSARMVCRLEAKANNPLRMTRLRSCRHSTPGSANSLSTWPAKLHRRPALAWHRKRNLPSMLLCRQHAITREHRRTLLLSARTMTVNVHRGGSGRNCRETIASLRNARTTRYDVTDFVCRLSRQWLRRQRYHVLARIVCECR